MSINDRYEGFNSKEFVILLNDMFNYLVKKKSKISFSNKYCFSNEVSKLEYDIIGDICFFNNHIYIQFQEAFNRYTFAPTIRKIIFENDNHKVIDNIFNNLDKSKKKYLYNLLYKIKINGFSREKIRKLLFFLNRNFNTIIYVGSGKYTFNNILLSKEEEDLKELRCNIKNSINKEKRLIQALEQERKLQEEYLINLKKIKENKKNKNNDNKSIYFREDCKILQKLYQNTEQDNFDTFKGNISYHKCLYAIGEYKLLGIILYDSSKLRKYTNIVIDYIDINRNYINDNIEISLLKSFNYELNDTHKIILSKKISKETEITIKKYLTNVHSIKRQ